MSKDMIEKTSIVTTSALFSKNGKERYLLKASWDTSKKSLAVLMTFPSTADDLLMDQTTMLVRNNAVRQGFGTVAVCNLHASINNENPRTMDKQNSSIVIKACEEADVILVCFGRGTGFDEEKKAFLDALAVYRDKLYTLVDSKGLPYSHPLSPLAHEWRIERLKLE